MLTLTGITPQHPHRPALEALRGSALAGLGLGLALAFAAAVWRAPSAPAGATAAAAAPAAPCTNPAS